MRHSIIIAATLVAVWGTLSCGAQAPEPTTSSTVEVHFRPVQPELFRDSGALTDAWADIDGDGDPDRFVGFNGAPSRLYRNDRGNGYVDVAIEMGLNVTRSVRTAAWGDFDKDGDPDLMLGFAGDAPVTALYRNDGNAGFTNVAGLVGLELTEGTTRQASWVDYDADGDLDLFIANYKNSYTDGQMASPYYDANDGYPAYLFRNDGNGVFRDITEAAGLGTKRFRRTYSSSFVDLDDDTDMDLIVISDFAGLDLYLNNGQGQFTDVTDTLGRDRHLFGMSHTFGDYDLDGNLDFYVTGMGSTTARRLEGMGLGPDDKPEHNDLRSTMGYGNRMFVRRGDKFSVAAFNDQIAQSGWSWGTSSFDFDNDGDEDIFVANGHISGKSIQDYCTVFWRHDIYTDDSQDNVGRENMFEFVMSPLQDTAISWNGYEHKVLWMNEGGARFTNVAYLLGVAFEYDARAVVTDDLDGDGHVDLLVVEFLWETDNHTLHVYQNRLPEAGNWIGVRLREGGPGLSTIGTTVTVRTKAGSQMRRFVTGDSFSAQHSSTAHFGLGSQTEVEAIEVRWPNGTTRRIDRPVINQYLTVESPVGTN